MERRKSMKFRNKGKFEGANPFFNESNQIAALQL
jgi:hypothetical protein